jgi:hypothetical protein
MPPGIFVDSMILESAGRLSCSIARSAPVCGALESSRGLAGVGNIDFVTESIGERAGESRPEIRKKICPMVHIRNKTAETAKSPFIRILRSRSPVIVTTVSVFISRPGWICG